MLSPSEHGISEPFYCFYQSESSDYPHLCLWIYEGQEGGNGSRIFCGLLEDIFFGLASGNALPLLYPILAMPMDISSDIYGEDIKLPLALISASELVLRTGNVRSYVLMRSRFDFFYYFRRIILPELLYTILVTLFLYRAIYMIDQKLEPKRDLKERIDIV